MMDRVLQRNAAWAEDRATQRCDPSADPGAKTGAGAGHVPALLPSSPLRDWHESDKPPRHDAATVWQDAFFNPLARTTGIPFHAEPRQGDLVQVRLVEKSVQVEVQPISVRISSP